MSPRVPLALLLLAVGCAAEPVDFTISPNPVTFGEVDFAVEMPEEGYAPIATTLTNNGTYDVTLTLEAFDEDHLCVQGYPHDTLPGAMGLVAPGSSYVLNIAVCGYLPGERDAEVSTSVTVGTDADPATLTIPVTFTPVQSMGGETG